MKQQNKMRHITPSGSAISSAAKTEAEGAQNVPVIKREYEFDTSHELSSSANVSTINGQISSSAPEPSCIMHKLGKCIGKKLVKDELVKIEPTDDSEETYEQEMVEEMCSNGQWNAPNVPLNLMLVKSEPQSEPDTQQTTASCVSTNNSFNPISMTLGIQHKLDCNFAVCEGGDLVKIEPTDDSEETFEQEMVEEMCSNGQWNAPNVPLNLMLVKSEPQSEPDTQQTTASFVSTNKSSNLISMPSGIQHKLDCHFAVYESDEIVQTEPMDETVYLGGDTEMESGPEHDQQYEEIEDIDGTMTSSEHDPQGSIYAVANAQAEQQNPWAPVESSQEFTISLGSSRNKPSSSCLSLQSSQSVSNTTSAPHQPHQCAECNKSFARKCNLTRHLRIHSGSKPFHCPHCGHSASQSSHLKTHIRRHTGERPFTCTECTPSKSYRHQSSYIKHSKRHHTTEGLYQCDQCEKTFYDSSKLKYHRAAIHTGERPHACNQCSKDFVLPSLLKKHLAKVHPTKN